MTMLYLRSTVLGNGFYNVVGGLTERRTGDTNGGMLVKKTYTESLNIKDIV